MYAVIPSIEFDCILTILEQAIRVKLIYYQTEIVRLIFRLYLEGYSAKNISIRSSIRELYHSIMWKMTMS